MEHDTPTFFETDLPALLDWRFTAAEAARITQPVLHVGGSASGPWFAEIRELVLAWVPHAEDVVLLGADHSLAVTHPARSRPRSSTSCVATRSGEPAARRGREGGHSSRRAADGCRVIGHDVHGLQSSKWALAGRFHVRISRVRWACVGFARGRSAHRRTMASRGARVG